MKVEGSMIRTGLYGPFAFQALRVFSRVLEFTGFKLAATFISYDPRISRSGEWYYKLFPITEGYVPTYKEAVSLKSKLDTFAEELRSSGNSLHKLIDRLQRALKDEGHPWRVPLNPFEQAVVQRRLDALGDALHLTPENGWMNVCADISRELLKMRPGRKKCDLKEAS